jgi:hypothetical protein
MAYTQLKPRHTSDARVEEISRDASHYRLSIPAGRADQYRLAQLDDYAQLKRRDFPLRPPLTLSLSARTSRNSIPGTWGFGLWNDPFGMSLGFGGNPFRLPALPNAVWFFGASEESYLSFRAERSDEGNSRSIVEAPRRAATHASTTSAATNALLSAQRGTYLANGFLAQSFRSPRFHPWLMLAGLTLPFSRRMARRFMGKVIGDEGVRLEVDASQWHRYSLDWRETRVSFQVDGAPVFESTVSPHPPLGLVIWIDNQFAAFTPEGKIGFGVLKNPEPAWLEVKEIELK